MGLPRAGAAAAYDSTDNQPSMGAWVGDQESTVNDSAANPCPGAGTATASTFQVPQS